MKYKFFLLILPAVFLLGTAANARSSFSISHIDNSDGLTSNYVKSIYQDNFGFMWFGTKNGLNRYDGHSIRRYNCYDYEKHRGNNNISALYQRSDTLWVGTDRGIYIYDMRRETFSFFDIKSKDGVGAEDWVSDIIADNHGIIWILIPNQGVFRINGYDTMEYFSVTNHGGDKNKLPLCLNMIDESLYVGTYKRGLYKYDSETHRFREVGNPQVRKTLGNLIIQSLCSLNEHVLLVCDDAGRIFTYDILADELKSVPFSQSGSTYLRNTLKVENELWIGTQTGLYIIDLASGAETQINANTMGESGLSDNTIGVLYPDREGNVWIGTLFGGINYFQRKGLIFERLSQGSSPRSLSGKLVRGMTYTPDGRLWIGFESGGYDCFDTKQGKIILSLSRKNSDTGVLNVKSKGFNVYIGQIRNGLSMIDSKSGRIYNIWKKLNDDANSVYAVLEDSKGNLWVGLEWGLYVRWYGHRDFEEIESVGFDWISDVFEAADGTIWIASMGNGAWTYHPDTETYKHYAFDENYTNGLRSNTISAVAQDSKGNIWLSTDRGGLSRFNPQSDNFTTYSIEEGLPDNVVYNVLEDQRGFLWFGTNSGLVKFDPETGKIKVFTSNRADMINNFGYHSAVKDEHGMFYFGGIGGIIVFDPLTDDLPDSLPSLYLTDMKIGNDEIVPSQSNSSLKENLLYTDILEIPHTLDPIRFSVAAPNYVSHNVVKYSYRLLPNSKQWIDITNTNELFFATLSAGKYTLELRSSYSGLSSIHPYTLTILPSWYESWWAYLIYGFLFVSIISVVWHYYKCHRNKEMIKRANILSIKKEKELYANKIQFFTEIAHEIRTPLSLINSPLEAIDEIGVSDDRIKRYLHTIRLNTNRLLDLANHLLDFQKIDRDQHALTFAIVDVSAMMQEIINRFEQPISLKAKKLSVDIPQKSVFATIDKEAITKILSNLFNNAMKYSKERIDISMSISDTAFSVSVASDGSPIKGEDRLKIFEPFYQIEHTGHEGGVGIGLPLASTLAKLHNGSLRLADSSTLSNTFILEIPLRQEGIDTEPETNSSMAEYVMEEESTFTQNEIGYRLLLVEDNDEMRDFLCEQLTKSFDVESACNGKEALVQLGERKFDMVITDVMMPEMDGYELCRTIKENEEISNIPVVFITAKNDLESKIKALKCGGEAYIEKPFSLKYLHQQIMSLLDNRIHERKAFMKQPFFSVDKMKLNKADEEFMNKVVAIITENISDENFSVEAMTEALYMSRSSLLRRIKALFNLSPVELIRLIKLKKAAEFIQEGKYRIGDVCFMVGINSSSYFSKLFSRQFGVTPKVFEKQCQQRKNKLNQENTGNEKS